jgi:serine/threonine-protein kinase
VTVLASPTVALPERDTIGRYELLLELGRGGMAVLYLACMRAFGVTRLFAIKRILPHLAADPVFVEMFLAESRIAARLSHPNVCTVFELGRDRGEMFLVMEYIDGVAWEALATAAQPDAHARLGLSAGVLAQACDGLHHAHTFHDVDGTPMPVVHRDVSPQNLLVSVDGTCHIVDFGIAKVATDPRRTRTGVRKGKLPYMAPEHVRGEPLDARADVWAIGVMLWEALTGARLFDRDSDFRIYQAISDGEIPSVNAAGARYPDAVDRIIARALARDRDQRYATARDLGHDLRELAGGAGSRDAIAGALGARCAEQLAARKHAIAAAIARLPPAEAALATAAATDAATDAATEPGAGAGEPPDAARDAAETASMAMRRDAIVVERPRRRLRLAGVLGLAALAGGVAGIVAMRGRSTEPPEAAAVDPARAAADSASGTTARPIAAAGDGSRATALRGAGSTAQHAGAGAPSRQAADSASGTTVRPIAAVGDGSRATALRGSGSTEQHVGTGAPSRQAADSASGTTLRPIAAAGDPPRRTASRAATPAAAGPARSSPSAAHGGAEDAAAAAAPAPGWYAIDSTPYATIYVDDRKIGDTPLDRISLPAGSHRVRAVLADGRQRSFAIDIAPDRKTSSGTLTW